MDVGLVCDECCTFNVMGTRSCKCCGDGLSLDRVPAGTGQHPRQTPPASALQSIACSGCLAEVPATSRFCGECGVLITEVTKPAVDNPMAGGTDAPVPSQNHRPSKSAAGSETMLYGKMQLAKARLVLIKGDGDDGISFTLAGEEHSVGRSEATILFDKDNLLSPLHGNFFYRNGRLVVRDEESENGIFVRIKSAQKLEIGDRFTVGEQLLEIQATESRTTPSAMRDGTFCYASPHQPAAFRLMQILRGGREGLALRTAQPCITLGRTENDVNFPSDPFISGSHAQITVQNGEITLTDVGSRNGTFLRIKGEQELSHGDYVFMGQQLLRIEII